MWRDPPVSVFSAAPPSAAYSGLVFWIECQIFEPRKGQAVSNKLKLNGDGVAYKGNVFAPTV